MGFRKAISPIISIVILLLIVIAIAGAGYSYISMYWGVMLNKEVEVLDASCYPGNQGKITIRNSGTSSFSTGEITIKNSLTGEDISQNGFWSSNITDASKVMEIRFEEGSGNTAGDTSGRGNHGKLYNGTEACSDPPEPYCPQWVEGRIGKAMNFSGEDDYVNISDSELIANEPQFTVSLWFKTEYGVGYQAMYAEADGGGTSGFTSLGLSSGNLAPYYYDGTVFAVIMSSTSYADGNWHHFIFVKRASNDYEAYIDGNSFGTSSTDVTGTIGVTNVRIGGMKWNTNNYPFNGLVDEVIIFNRSLFPGETLQPGEEATFTHICTGRCQYSLVLGGEARETMLECL